MLKVLRTLREKELISIGNLIYGKLKRSKEKSASKAFGLFKRICFNSISVAYNFNLFL